jgi:hypothetical protein
MNKRIKATLVAAAVLAGTMVGGSASAAPKVETNSVPQAAQGAESERAVAAAADDCYTYVNLPDKVSMDRPELEIRVSLVDSCYASYAYFYIYGPQGEYTSLYYDPAYNGATDYWWIDTWFTQPGLYSTPLADTDGIAYDNKSMVKFGSKAGLTAKRSGNKVNLTACASYYHGFRDAFVPWQGNKATIQQQTKDGQWRFVRTVTLNSSGCGSYNYTNKYSGTYRVTTYETSKIWPRTSSFARA